MSALAGHHANHTIHKDHIHHGWNNAFEPCLRIAPGETIEFRTVDASSGQLTRDSTAADLKRLARAVARSSVTENRWLERHVSSSPS